MLSNACEPLLGHWRIDPSDVEAIERLGQVSLVFGMDGSLRYTVHEPDKDSIILLTYRVEGDSLITDQPSSPGEERTRFSFTTDGKLVLEFGGVESRYIR